MAGKDLPEKLFLTAFKMMLSTRKEPLDLLAKKVMDFVELLIFTLIIAG